MTIIVNGERIACASDVTVAAALSDARIDGFRSSVTGEQRGPVCGMGVCYECRVTIDDVPHRRACLVMVAEGMRVTTAVAR